MCVKIWVGDTVPARILRGSTISLILSRSESELHQPQTCQLGPWESKQEQKAFWRFVEELSSHHFLWAFLSIGSSLVHQPSQDKLEAELVLTTGAPAEHLLSSISLNPLHNPAR